MCRVHAAIENGSQCCCLVDVGSRLTGGSSYCEVEPAWSETFAIVVAQIYRFPARYQWRIQGEGGVAPKFFSQLQKRRKFEVTPPRKFFCMARPPPRNFFLDPPLRDTME